ncbi:MAG TPA: hypothetical protein VFK02_12740 [Kofleriaceae bacterium]|nr:hypothetical protein [Kofleriaceae bacterium]
MRRLLLRAVCAFASVLVTACSGSHAGSEPTPDARSSGGSKSPRIHSVQAVPLGQLRYHIVVDIDNFFAATHMDAEVHVPTAFDITDPLLPPPTRLYDIKGPRIELDTEPLHAFTSYQTFVTLHWSEGAMDPVDHLALGDHAWVTGPPELTTGPPATVGDTGPVTVVGNGLGMIKGMQLAVRPDPASNEVRIDLAGIVCSHTQCVAQVPVVLSPLPGTVRTFAGVVPPATVHLIQSSENEGEKDHDAAVGTTQLVYEMSSPGPSSGVAGSELVLALFHPARAPKLDGLTVRFDEESLTPAGVFERSQHTPVGDRYFTQARFQVPAAAEPGVHHLRAVTALGEELRCGNCDFTVTAP